MASSDSQSSTIRLIAEHIVGPLRDAIRYAEAACVAVYAQKEAPFDDVLALESEGRRALVILGDPPPALAALWIRSALSPA